MRRRSCCSSARMIGSSAPNGSSKSSASGSSRQRAHQADALPLSARELERITRQQRRRQLHQFRERRDARVDLGARTIARGEGDILPRRQMREEAAVLDDVADAAARVAIERRAVERNLAGVGREQAHAQTQQRRLAASRRTEQDGAAAAWEVEVDVDGELRAEELANAAEPEHPRIIEQMLPVLRRSPSCTTKPAQPTVEEPATRSTFAIFDRHHKMH